MKLIGKLAVLGAFALATLAHAEERTVSQSGFGEDEIVQVGESLTAEGWQTILDQNYKLPRGTSYTDAFVLSQPIKADRLLVELFVKRDQVCGITNLTLYVAHTPTQTSLTPYTIGSTGVIELPTNKDVYKVAYTFEQPRHRNGYCGVRLSYAAAGDSNVPTEPNTGYQRAGVIRYEGGFREMTVPVQAGKKVLKFRVDIPPFCRDLQIADAGTVTEGNYEAARLVDEAQNIYAVNGGNGTYASAVSLSFNGPIGLACDVPVYFKTN